MRAYSFIFISDLGDDFGELFVHCLAFSVGKILNCGSGRIAGTNQHKNALSLLVGHVRKRLDTICSRVSVDGYGVGGKVVFEAGQFRIFEMSGGVSCCGMAYVTAFYVADYFQAQLVSLGNQGIVSLQAFPEILFKKRNVYLHSGNHRGNDSHCLCAKIEDSIDRGGGIKLIVHLAMTSYRRGQSGVNRVQPDNQRSFLGFHGVAKTVSKMTCHILNPHNFKNLF
ncbi:hypothetical protein ES703_125719 [subsurface metagenome]